MTYMKMSISDRLYKEVSPDRPIFVLNTIYHRPRKNADGKMGSDALSILVKDSITGEKTWIYLPEPTLEAYIANEDINISYPLKFLEEESVKPIELPYQTITRSIAELAGKKYEQYYWDQIKLRRFSATKELHKWVRIFSSDIDIEDHYRIKIRELYPAPENLTLTKGAFDIEVDTIDINGFPHEEEAACPINTVAFVSDVDDTCYTFILRNNDNELMTEFENNAANNFREMKAEFNDKLGKDLQYRVAFFDDELDLIKSLFSVINHVSPDFLLAWNIKFDLRYIINRILNLGGDPQMIMCHPELIKRGIPLDCVYIPDKRNYDPRTKSEVAIITAYTVYMDQLINYASVRKAKSMESYTLEDIAKLETGYGKEDYSEEASNLRTLPYKNFYKFIKYNIWDTLVAFLLEERTNDLDTIMLRSYNNGTRLSKCFKQTILLKNRSFIEYKDQGLIKGNNQNINYNYQWEAEDKFDDDDEENEKEDEKFEGAIVGDPLLNAANGIYLHGKRSRFVFENVVDFDFSSLYPSIIITFNIGANTQFFKLVLDKSDFFKIEADSDYDAGGEFLDDLQTRDWMYVGYKWFNLPPIEQVLNDISVHFCNEEVSVKSVYLNADGIKVPLFRKVS